MPSGIAETVQPPLPFERRLGLMVLVGAVAIFVWGIWAIPVLSHIEAYRMVVVQEMVQNRQWLLPYKNGVLYVAKPPLFYWIASFFSLMTQSTAEWVLRLPSALSGLLVLWFFYDRVKRYYSLRTALFTALILTTSESFNCYARRAEIEMLFTLFCSVAVLFFLDYLKTARRRYLYLCYLLLGLAVLTKGPVALIFFLPPLLVFGLWFKDREALRGLAFIPGWLLLLVVALPWFLYVVRTVGLAPLTKVIETDLADKIVAATPGAPWYTYLVFLLGAFAPWIVVSPCHRPWERLKKIFSTPDQGFWAICALVPLLLMSCFSSKHGKYLLPAFPFLATFLAIWFDGLFSVIEGRWQNRARTFFLGAASALLAGFFLFYLVVEPRLFSYRFSAFPLLIEKIKTIQNEAPVYLYQQEHIQLIYYYGKPMPVLDQKKVRDLVAEGDSFLLVADDRTWPELAGEDLCMREEFSPFLSQKRAVRLYGSRRFCE